MWAIPVPGFPTEKGSSWYYDHGLYITNGAPPHVCEPPVVIEEGNETMIANAKARDEYEAAGARAAMTGPAGENITEGFHAPLKGTCAFGYELRVGEVHNYGNCAGSHEFGYCILEPIRASEMCEKDPECSGVSESSNAEWQRDYPGLQMLGRLPLYANTDWRTCMKAAAGRTWDHLTLLEQERERSGNKSKPAEAASLAQLQMTNGRQASNTRMASAKKRAEAFVGAPLGKKWH
jgi:hypothetical protein